MSQLQSAVTELAGHIHAATAELARLAADLDDSGDWRGEGMISCAHWLAVHAGFDTWTAGELIRAGHALRDLPHIAQAFAAGRLSFDKVRSLVQVAHAEDDQAWLSIALAASGSQLSRLCREFRDAVRSDEPDRAAAQQRKRRLTSWWREDGMLELFATLPPEDAAVVLNAIEGAMLPAQPDGVGAGAHPADRPIAARRLDALVAVCNAWFEGAAPKSGAAARRQLVVHVDVGTLISGGEGRCHVEDGPALPASAALRLGCDADLMSVIEKDGVPVHIACNTRVVSTRMHTLLQLRDRTCRYPGCNVSARKCEAHHVVHWIEGGATALHNLITLCRFHHHRHHDGEFEIVKESDSFRFLNKEGRALDAQPPRAEGVQPESVGTDAEGAAPRGAAWLRQSAARSGRRIGATSAGAGDRGERLDHDHALLVLANSAQLRAARDGPPP
jgi:Domain of unknown function (DUF222)